MLVLLSDASMADDFTRPLTSAGYLVEQVASSDAACARLAEGDVHLALADIEWGREELVRIIDAARDSSQPCPVGVIVGWWDERVGEVYQVADLLVYKPPTDRQLLAAAKSVVPTDVQPLSA